LLTGFIARCYPKSLGRASIWGSEELVRTDSFNDPQGSGWRLDRRDFDTWLVAEAQRGGADVVRSCRLTAIRRTGQASFPWAVAAALPNGDKEIVATRFLVDATGRRAAIARLLGATTTRIDRLVCTYAVHPAGAPTCLDGFSVVEAAPDGWFYAARLPSGARQRSDLAGFLAARFCRWREGHGHRPGISIAGRGRSAIAAVARARRGVERLLGGRRR